MRRSAPLVALCSLVVGTTGLVGCVDDRDAADVVTRVDSAGVQIVTSPDLAGAPFTPDSAPDLRLGGPDATGPAQFGQVQGVAVASDGSIWVADRQSADVRVFEADGAFRMRVGGRGDGPGEFRVLRLLGESGDSVAIVDDRGGRLSWFGLDGTLLSGSTLARAESTAPMVSGVAPDGTLGGALQRILPATEAQPGDTLGGLIRFVAWAAPHAIPEVFASAPSVKWLWTGTDQVPIPFTTNAGLAVGERLVVVGGVEPEVRYYSAAGLERIARVDRPPRSVDASMRSAYEVFIREVYPEERHDALLDALDHPLVPDVAPAYARVLVSTDGSVWAQHFTADRRDFGGWDVFTSAGDFLGTVPNPDELWLHAVTDDALVGIWFDELGVSHLQRHRLVSGARAP